MIRFNNYKSVPKVNVCKCKECEQKVQQGLAYTPSDMEKLHSRGMPVNTQNFQSMFNDGHENPSFHIESYKVKDVDVAELWEEHEVLKEKARTASRESKKS